MKVPECESKQKLYCPLYSSTIILVHAIPLSQNSTTTNFRFRYSPPSQRSSLDFVLVFGLFSRLSSRTSRLEFCPPSPPSISALIHTTPSLERHRLNVQLSASTSQFRYFAQFRYFVRPSNTPSLDRVVPRSQCPSIAISFVRDLTGPQASIFTFPHPSTRNMSFGRNGLDLIRRVWDESSLDREHDAWISFGWIVTRWVACRGADFVERKDRDIVDGL